MLEIRRFLRDDNPVKVSRSLKETAYKVNKCRDSLTKELGRDPKISEIADILDIGIEEVVAALEAVQTPTSIHETLYQDDGDPIYLLDQLTNDTDEEPPWFDKLALKEVLNKLPVKEREVLLLRFFQDKTQTEVAEAVGLSQVQVSRIERQALRKIKNLLSQEPNIS